MPARSLLISIALTLWPGLAAAGDRVVAARLEGSPADDPGAARAVVQRAIGRPPDDATLAAVVRDLERVPGVGSLRVRRRHDADGVHVVFAHDGVRRRVADISFVIDGTPVDATAAVRWHRRLDASTAGLHLAPGTRHHPFLLDLDRATLVAWCDARGYRGAKVRPEVAHVGGLTTLTWHLDRGPPYEVTSLRVEGAPELARVPRLSPGDPIAPEVVESDLRRLRARLCHDGYPRARVRAQEAPAPTGDANRRGVAVRYLVERGVRLLAGPVQVAGRRVPVTFVEGLPLRRGGPYCPALVDESLRRLKAYLRNEGVPDPRVRVEERTWLDSGGRRLRAVTFDIRWLSAANVERIWFDGNRVTRVDVLEQMLAIAPGDVYRQHDVDASVQAMRRSGLFRRVNIEVLPGSSPDRVYLTFRLVERDALGFDVVDQQLIVFNVDVAHWPDDFAHFETGQPFRGAGQRLDVFGQSSFQAVRWRDDFLTRRLVTRLGFERSISSNAGFEEQWLNLSGGFGVKAMEGAFRAVVFTEAEWTFADQAEGDLPVLDGDALTIAGGLDLELDLSRRDDERVEYLGAELDLTGRAGRAVRGADFNWANLKARVRGHLPLWRTDRGQHLVLRTTARLRSVFADSQGRLQPHQRVFPSARGYSSGAIGVEFPLGDGDRLELGGLHALDGAIELRMPLPFGRRNALSPFAEVAAVSDARGELLDDLFPTAGLAFAFSFFSERLEGVVWGAWAFRDEAEHEYVGISLGGNF